MSITDSGLIWEPLRKLDDMLLDLIPDFDFSIGSAGNTTTVISVIGGPIRPVPYHGWVHEENYKLRVERATDDEKLREFSIMFFDEVFRLLKTHNTTFYDDEKTTFYDDEKFVVSIGGVKDTFKIRGKMMTPTEAKMNFALRKIEQASATAE